MKVISLSQGMDAVVDDDIYAVLNQHNWWIHKSPSGTLYAARKLKKKKGEGSGRRFMHNDVAILKGIDRSFEIDHKDGDGLNNQAGNLRPATRTQNQWNTGPRKNNKCGYKGVRFHLKNKKWIAGIRRDKKTVYLGSFPTLKEAVIAYNLAALADRGEFAYINPIPEEEEVSV